VQFALSKTRQAIALYERGETSGKVVITL